MISTSIICEALNFYCSCGFNMVDVPLVVDEEISNHTKPVNRKNIHHAEGKVYVASAEQSFLQLFHEGKLPDGKYMALTPCCRDEETLDNAHFKTFLKLELIVVGGGDVRDTLYPACRFFNSHCPASISEEKGVIDINIKGVEVGSYGVRSFYKSDKKYVFGTGVAEPRFSFALSLNTPLNNISCIH